MNPCDFSGVRLGDPLPSPDQFAMPDDMQVFLDDYIECTSGQLEELEQYTLAYESNPASSQDAAGIRRILHKLKGEAGMVGLESIAAFCHEVEEAFEELEVSMRPDMLLRFKDWTIEALASLQQAHTEERRMA